MLKDGRRTCGAGMVWCSSERKIFPELVVAWCLPASFVGESSSQRSFLWVFSCVVFPVSGDKVFTSSGHNDLSFVFEFADDADDDCLGLFHGFDTHGPHEFHFFLEVLRRSL